MSDNDNINRDAENEEAIEVVPTPQEARAMFNERPDLSGVMTTDGWKNRGEC